MADADNPLKVLGLSSECTLDEVRERYRVLCLKYHPDKNPGNEVLFQAVSEAYNKLRIDPSIIQRQRNSGPHSYLDAPITLTIRDFYYAEEKSMRLQRLSVCRTCSGTGSKVGRAGVCTCCAGQGIIESAVLTLMGRDNICPICKGSGIVGEPCPSCHGEKRIHESITARFRATLYVYYKKHVLIKGMGNGRPDGTHEDLMVKVKIHEDPYVTIDGDSFQVYVNVTPAQRTAGDKGILEFFDRKLPYTIKPGDVATNVIDGIRGTFTRNVFIKFREYIPDITPDTAKLYDSIKELEKHACSQIGSIVMTKDSFRSAPQSRCPPTDSSA